MAFFRRAEDYAPDEVRRRLDAVDRQIDAQEGIVRVAALAGVLDDGDTRASAASVELDRLHTVRRVLVAALRDAEDRTAVAQAARDRKAAAGRHKALAAHLARCRKAAGEMQDAIGAMRKAWDRLQTAAEDALKLVPPHTIYHADYVWLHAAPLARAVEMELARAFSRSTRLGEVPAMPGAPRLPGGQTPQTTPSLTDTLAAETQAASDRFRRLLGLDTPEPAASASRGSEEDRHGQGSALLAIDPDDGNPPAGSAPVAVQAPLPAPAPESHSRRRKHAPRGRSGARSRQPA